MARYVLKIQLLNRRTDFLPIWWNRYRHGIASQLWQSCRGSHKRLACLGQERERAGVKARTVYKNNEPAENIKFYWESNLYWVSGIDGIEVPTSNTTSVSGSDGEVSNMIAPVQIMAGDSLILNYVYFDWIYESDTYSGEMRFVLE